MAKILDFLFSSNGAKVEEDKGFYMAFVMWVAFEKFEYANRRAADYADLLERGQKPVADWVDDFVARYGDLFDESDDEIKKMLTSDDIPAIVDRLRETEADYGLYFREQVTQKLAKIEEAFGEARQRTRLDVQHKSATDLRELINGKSPSERAVHEVIKGIKGPVFAKAYQGFENRTYGPTEHMVTLSSGQESDAELVWSISLRELFKKIKKGPYDLKSGYRWYDRSKTKKGGEPALMSSFFMNIARFRWLDIKVRPVYGNEELENAPPEPDDHYEIDKLRATIPKLGEPCASIIWYHHVEEYSLEEVAEKIGRSYGYVRTLHRGCMGRLRDLLDNSDD
ncbi:RNA polymerase sigma factor [Larkinella terrae]|uniref:Sigma-70 family RNA polymerase sigma factor n=1 Tax=Larkinella terrae TaxID=2025311 RepID=A0A7K0EES2_9BACT|nr:sigma-70 family RNA polymerase sigma factor [Larkinella terrae]MRS60317.1 hypothetical protein [Larkinella terrae]